MLLYDRRLMLDPSKVLFDIARINRIFVLIIMLGLLGFALVVREGRVGSAELAFNLVSLVPHFFFDVAVGGEAAAEA